MPETIPSEEAEKNADFEVPETGKEEKLEQLSERNLETDKNLSSQEKELLDILKDRISMSGLLNNSPLSSKEQDKLYQTAKETALFLLKKNPTNNRDDLEKISEKVEKFVSEKINK